MMGGFPLIIPNDPIMQMKIAEKVTANINTKKTVNSENIDETVSLLD